MRLGYEPEINAKGARLIWLEERWLDKLNAVCGPGGSYSEVILRRAEIEESRPGLKRKR
jgi:hypothetical protein